MGYFSKQGNLTVDPLSICFVLKCEEDLLDGIYLLRLAVTHFPDMTVGPTTDLMDDFILLLDRWV